MQGPPSKLDWGSFCIHSQISKFVCSMPKTCKIGMMRWIVSVFTIKRSYILSIKKLIISWYSWRFTSKFASRRLLIWRWASDFFLMFVREVVVHYILLKVPICLYIVFSRWIYCHLSLINGGHDEPLVLYRLVIVPYAVGETDQCKLKLSLLICNLATQNISMLR